MEERWLAGMWIAVVVSICVLLGTIAWRAQDGYNLWAANLSERGGSVVCEGVDTTIVAFQK
jgi:hypothetical protein